ncbi:Magnesium transport protein CorA [Corynebacterium diphtheriae subsp. lausannense]|nr:Magnesium transport protein CorA [Corynebacterium belfantii]SPJ40711.1 Magnesium transport protein CorA [Corynebacterium diphtheriae subsp. lausannense]STC66748.1 magnesium/cobalt transporter CorA [Corynebacterium diphtheriae]
MIAKQLRSYLRDVLDHEMVAKDHVANFDERLSSLIDAGVAKISLQQNSDMRAISAYVGLAAVPTLIAGIYGMNFENMPELATNYGYYIVILVMVLTVSLMWWYFRNMNWIGN